MVLEEYNPKIDALTEDAANMLEQNKEFDKQIEAEVTAIKKEQQTAEMGPW